MSEVLWVDVYCPYVCQYPRTHMINGKDYDSSFDAR